MTVGQFDYPPSKSFVYHQSYPAPRKFNYADRIAQDYYSQYVEWQRKADDPELRRYNYWADNWEELGKYL